MHDALRKDNKTGLVQEYRTLASALSYLYDTKEHFSSEILPLDATDPETELAIQTLHNGLEGVFTLLNTRFSFVSARALAGSQDPDLVAFLQSKVYGSLGGLEVTSTAVGGWLKEFESAKTSATLRERAKRAAGQDSSSSSTTSGKKKVLLKKRVGKPAEE